MKIACIKYLVFILFLVFLSSCALQKEIQIEVLKPSDIELPSHIKSVLLVDNTIPQLNTTGNFYLHKKLNNAYKVSKIERVERLDTVAVDSLAISCIYNTANVLLQSNYLDTVIVLKDSNLIKNNVMLMPSQVKILAIRYNVDAVISLDKLTYQSVVEYSTWYNDLYDLSAYTSYELLWRFYDGKTLEQLNRKEFGDTLYYDISYSNIADKGFVEAMISETVWEAGAESARKMYPWWKTVTRVYFESGAPDLRIGSKYYKNGDYENAAKYWAIVFQNYNGKNKARAALNLALYSELIGDLEKALEYLQKAKFVYEDSKLLLETNPEYELIKTYFNVIKARMDDEEKLLN